MKQGSWKTTLAGAVGALGVYLQSQTQYGWAPMTGQIMCGLGTFLIGYFARDNNVSSEQAGIKPKE